jgi:hypothetical protein
MSGGCNMRRLCAIVTILLPLAVMAAQAGSISFSVPDPQAHRADLRGQGTPNDFADSTSSFQLRGGAPTLVAHGAADSPGKGVKAPENGSASDLDLRYVDWDLVKKGTKGKNGNGKAAVKNGDNGNGDKDENGEDEEGEKKSEDEKDKDEKGGGWDRLWDAQKLG